MGNETEEGETPHIPVIKFDTVLKKFSEIFENEDFSSLGEIDGKSINDALEEAVNDFNKITDSNLFSQNPKKTIHFITFLKSKFYRKSCITIASNWPPVMPTPTHSTISIWPSSHAICNGVLPLASWLSLLHPLEIKYSTIGR